MSSNNQNHPLNQLPKIDDYFFIKANNPNPKGTILFIHGFTSSYLLHHLFVLNNSFDDYNYLAINLTGHEFEDNTYNRKKVLKEYSLNKYVEQLKRIIEDQKLYNLILIGHSMGGGIAVLLYQQIKSRVLKIILVSSINQAIYKSSIGLYYVFSSLLEKKNNIRVLNLYNKLDLESDQYQVMNDYMNYEIERYFKRRRKYWILGQKLIDPVLYTKLDNIFKTVKIPVLFLIGKYDKVIPYRATKKYFKKVNNKHIYLKTIDNAAHVPFIDNFEAYNGYVWWFIKSKLI